jgi:hypothetical protein
MKNIKKKISAIKKRIFEKNDIATATPLKAKTAVIIATTKNNRAHNNNITYIPVCRLVGVSCKKI